MNRRTRGEQQKACQRPVKVHNKPVPGRIRCQHDPLDQPPQGLFGQFHLRSIAKPKGRPMMPRHQILSVRFPDAETPRPIETRLSAHLKTLRRTRLEAEASLMTPAPEGDDAPPPIPATGAFVKLTDADHAKIIRRAKRLHALREAACGLAHLRKEDRDRLAILRDGVDLVRLPTEHRADEIASALHADYPWLAPATEVVWQALRRSVREG